MTARVFARSAVIALLSMACAAPALAQEDPTARRAAVVDVPLLERNRIFKNMPDDETGEIYEALLGVHFLVGGSMQDSYDAAREQRQTKPADWALLPTITMLVNLRQLQADSSPVRTPSYMPRFRMTAVRTAAPNANATTSQWVFDGTFGHYSNGQDGCTFLEQDPRRDCAFREPIAAADLTVNGIDGSFSSHYLEGAAARRWITWGDALFGNTRVPSMRVVGAYVRVRDYKLLSGVGGGMSDDIRNLYGSLRIRAGVDAVFENDAPGNWQGPRWAGAWVEHSNGHERVGRWRAAAEIGKTFDRMHGTGVFLRAYAGHDDYNIAFLRKIAVLQIGIALGGERRPTFRF